LPFVKRPTSNFARRFGVQRDSDSPQIKEDGSDRPKNLANQSVPKSRAVDYFRYHSNFLESSMHGRDYLGKAQGIISKYPALLWMNLPPLTAGKRFLYGFPRNKTDPDQTS